DPAAVKRPHEAVAALAGVEQDGEAEVRASLDLLVAPRDRHARYVAQPRPVATDDLAPARHVVFEPGQAAEGQRGARFVEAEVEADVHDVVALGVAAMTVPGHRGHRV